MTEISVIMPVFNTKISYLREAIESVLSQSFTDFEFLILNDSPENRELRATILQYNDKRIKYFENGENIGIPKSYNKLLSLANSKYVALMNHDDIMKPSRLAKQFRYLEEHPEIGMLGTAYKKFGELNRFRSIINPCCHEEICAYLLFRSSMHHPTIMLRREIAEKYKIKYNENFISLNDRELCYEFSKYSKLANLPEVLYKYRFHGGMVSKIYKDVIRHEREMFHKLWFAYNNIDLPQDELDVFDNYTTYGRNKICDIKTLQSVIKTLEKLSDINKKRQILDVEIFDKICGIYANKRCANALVNGHINISEIIKGTKLPLNKPFLLFLNAILGWK